MKDPDQNDQAIERPTYNDSEIARQLQEGLLSRPEADVFDILATSGVVSSVNISSCGNEQAERSNEQTQRMLISHIRLRCLWDNVPMLRRWIAQFLAKRQPDATIIAGGMAKQGVTKFAVNKQPPSLVHSLLLCNCATCKRSRKSRWRKTRPSFSPCRLI